MKKILIIFVKILIVASAILFGVLNISRSYIAGGIVIIAAIVIWSCIDRLNQGSPFPWKQWLLILISVAIVISVQIAFSNCIAHYSSVDFVNAPKHLYDSCLVNLKFI